MQQIISVDRLQSAQRILFIFDLSFKDFLSIQSYLFEFSKNYPVVKIDLWVNANCECFWGHKQSFKEKLFIEFLQECSFINKFYFNTCCTKNFKNIYVQARDLDYSIIVVLSEQSHCRNIKLAKKINKNGFLISTTSKTKWYNFAKRHVYKMLGAKLDLDYGLQRSFSNNIFLQLFSEQFVGNHKPALFIPRKWVVYAKLKFMKWGIDKKGQRFGKVFFINAFDDNEKYSCSLKKILDLIMHLKRHDEWGDINFVLHVPPSKLRSVRKSFAKHSVNNMYLFSADNNFYQVPSILSLCDGVFSVDGICSELSSLLQINNLDSTDQSS
ncbi:MAG: hypothetical protein V1646_01450 [bacterium]